MGPIGFPALRLTVLDSFTYHQLTLQLLCYAKPASHDFRTSAVDGKWQMVDGPVHSLQVRRRLHKTMRAPCQLNDKWAVVDAPGETQERLVESSDRLRQGRAGTEERRNRGTIVGRLALRIERKPAT